ncbi:hypothetical protein [Aurantiacibacter flavus]|uniref:DUF4185 domain-containing protein n=1 Tax=Aurantiacibacter flavus TaxID=3145232 RepID=A0ABV0D2B2_9SPHN
MSRNLKWLGVIKEASKKRRWTMRQLVMNAALATLMGCAPKTLDVLPQVTGLSRSIKVERLGSGPVIRPGMAGLEGELGENINGPAVIRVPDWIEGRLGRYYMYFAHHRGDYIRLAYADHPAGPWTVHPGRTLRLEQTTALHHIASPEVVVDEANRRLLLYFHGPVEMPGQDFGGRPYRQESFVAQSSDGLRFEPLSGGFSAPYMRVFSHRGVRYGLAMADKEGAYPAWLRSGRFFRAQDGLMPVLPGPRILDEMRHAALLHRGDRLHVFYSKVGDDPERIMHAQVDLRPHWSEWTAGPSEEVMRAQENWEGADLPATASVGGMAYGEVNALRDPAILDDGLAVYLYYTVRGERGIAMAQLHFEGESVNRDEHTEKAPTR